MALELGKFSDRLNPVLVKEVRAALRGRFFRTSFAIVLSLATVASLGFMMLSGSEDEIPESGSIFFALLFLCMSLAVHGLVPFSAMLAMTAESDEHTLELLQLSGLAGWRIVLGKLFATLLQAVLVYSAFTPFLMFAFLLHGVDIVTWLGLVASSLVACAAYSALGIFLGSLARSRWARVVLLLVFAVVLLQSSFGAIGVLFAVFGGARAMPMVGSLAGATVISGFAATCLFVVLASARLAHAEENQSTPLRVCVSLTILSALVAFAINGDPMSGQFTLFWALGLCLVPMGFAATERETLPRAVPASLPRRVAWRVVIGPWLPGGARGAVFVVLHLALAVLGFAAIAWLGHSTVPHAGDGIARLGVFAVLLSAFLLFPAALLARFTKTSHGRFLVRLGIVGIFACANLAPALAGFFLHSSGLGEWAPVTLLGTSPSPSGWFEMSSGADLMKQARLPFFVLMALLAILANIPRVVAAVRELVRVPVRPRAPSVEGVAADAATES